MLRGVWQALNCLSIHATYCVIITGASPGETKMWAAVHENDAFLALTGVGKKGQSGRFVANVDNGAITCIPINNNE